MLPTGASSGRRARVLSDPRLARIEPTSTCMMGSKPCVRCQPKHRNRRVCSAVAIIRFDAPMEVDANPLGWRLNISTGRARIRRSLVRRAGPRICRPARNHAVQEPGRPAPDDPRAASDAGFSARRRPVAHRAPARRFAGNKSDDGMSPHPLQLRLSGGWGEPSSRLRRPESASCGVIAIVFASTIYFVEQWRQFHYRVTNAGERSERSAKSSH